MILELNSVIVTVWMFMLSLNTDRRELNPWYFRVPFFNCLTATRSLHQSEDRFQSCKLKHR